MSEILCEWLNQEVKTSQTVTLCTYCYHRYHLRLLLSSAAMEAGAVPTAVAALASGPKSFAKAFSSGYLIGEVLHKFELQDDFSEFSQSNVSSAKLNNFSRLEPTLHLLGVQFDQKVASNIITEKPGAATKLLYQLYTTLQKKKKSGLTGAEMQTMQPLITMRLQNIKSEAFRDQRLSRRRQNEIMAKIQAAIIQIPKPTSNRTLKAIEAQKMMKKKREAEDVANEIKEFEALLKKDLQAKESTPKPSLDTAAQTTADLLSTYSDDDYIKKIQKRLKEDAFAREQREKRRRRLLMDQLIAHEAQEALARQAKHEFEEQAIREREIHEQIAVERAQALYQKHYLACREILDQILDLSTKVAEYRLLTNNLIPHKIMHDWKELFFHGKPIYEQASIKDLPARPSAEQLTEMEKRDLLDNNDYEEYKVLSIDTLLQEAIKAYHDNETVSETLLIHHETEEKALSDLHSSETNKTPQAEEIKLSDSVYKFTVRAQLGAKSEKLLKKGKSVSDTLLVNIMVNAINIIGFLDNWPLLEQWFTEPENILIKINAEVDTESLCQKVNEVVANEMVKKENKVKRELEEKEAAKKEEAVLAESPPLPPPPPPPPPEPEKEKEMHPPHERPKPGKGKAPAVSRVSISTDVPISKPKAKAILKGKTDYSLEKVEFNFETDEKLIMDTWQQASSAISHMVAAEIHQRLLDEEKENQPAETKEKSPQTNANKKVKKEPPKKKLSLKKEKEFEDKEVAILTAHYGPALAAANVQIDEVPAEGSVLKLETYAGYPSILTTVDLVLTLPANSVGLSSDAVHQVTEACPGLIGTKPFTDILLDLVTLNLGTNSLPSSWMHLTQPEFQELTSILTVDSEMVDWRKFLLVTSLPWPIPLEEELLETLRRFKAVDQEQSGTVTYEQYMQVAIDAQWH
ncbi:Sperm flagellar protein 2 [Myotis davidii]|uniref:Sperm flagellar protein 2 n=1 Tax=Myotis davidii TaxID=225400 RepID=L5LZ69_MYODS|nr:Sperm flagellar protein 2 [Myotis davidii]